jgi:hypothetical protein
LIAPNRISSAGRLETRGVVEKGDGQIFIFRKRLEEKPFDPTGALIYEPESPGSGNGGKSVSVKLSVKRKG